MSTNNLQAGTHNHACLHDLRDIMSNKLTTNQLITRYVLVGSGLGLYFGLFFRPARQPNLWFVLVLAFLITLVTTVIQAWRERPLSMNLLKTAVSIFIKAFLFLILLELRHPVYDYGGKIAVALFMTVMGALAGLWYALDRVKRSGKS